MKKGKKYILIGVGILAVSAGLFFWLRGKGTSKLDKE